MYSDLNMASGGDTSLHTLLTSRHPRRVEREGSEDAADRDGARCTRLAPVMHYVDKSALGGYWRSSSTARALIQLRFFAGTHGGINRP